MFNHAMAYVMSVIASPKREEKGATAVEYALVIGLVSILVVGALAAIVPLISGFIATIDFG
jgi:pilus assembly protein Flp/PilA